MSLEEIERLLATIDITKDRILMKTADGTWGPAPLKCLVEYFKVPKRTKKALKK